MYRSFIYLSVYSYLLYIHIYICLHRTESKSRIYRGMTKPLYLQCASFGTGTPTETKSPWPWKLARAKAAEAGSVNFRAL